MGGVFMPKKSALKETTCLVAALKPIMLSQKENDLQNAQNVEGLYRYAIELFDGIAKNETNSFEGKFDYSVSITPQQFLIYKKLKRDVASEQEYEEFMTAISILQMVFIDENIYLTGSVDLKKLIISKEGIVWGCSSENEVVRVSVGEALSMQYGEKFTKKMGNHYILDFLPTVYRFSPFKEEKGNMMRHIVNPINSVKEENADILGELITYCREYIAEKKFGLEL